MGIFYPNSKQAPNWKQGAPVPPGPLAPAALGLPLN